jgi:transglutaminase-like putative cysteine protease
MAIVVAPHALRAPAWITLLAAALIAWRAAAVALPRLMPPMWLLLCIVAVAMAGVWLEFRAIFGRTPGITLLVLFGGLKMLESRTQRDAAAVVFLVWFLAITNFLYTQSIPTALGMLAAVAVSIAALVGLAAPRRALRANLRTAALLLGQAVPAALVLFLLFPRIQGPLWGLPQDAYSAMSGLSESMTPGNISQLTLSDAIAFRVDFKEDLPPRRTLYWRGPVLWDFDGRTWRVGSPTMVEMPEPKNGTRISYSVLIEPHNRNWLFALESAALLPPRARFLDDGQIVALTPVRTRMRYEMVSRYESDPVVDEEEANLRRALRLPQGFNPRARALAERWRAASASDQQVLERAIEHFRVERLQYTTEPRLLGRDSVDEFLFDSREGFCEHFSSAFVFLMRAASVPARVIAGYQGGDMNPVDRPLHRGASPTRTAWAEVYLAAAAGIARRPDRAVGTPRRLESKGLARAVAAASALPLIMRRRWMAALAALQLGGAPAPVEPAGARLQPGAPARADVLARHAQDADWLEARLAAARRCGRFVLLLFAWMLRRRAARPGAVGLAPVLPQAGRARRGSARRTKGPRDYAERGRAQPARRAATRSSASRALYIGLRYGKRASARKRGRNCGAWCAETRVRMKRCRAGAGRRRVRVRRLAAARSRPHAYAKREDVQAFIRQMVEQHAFIERELRCLFSRARREPRSWPRSRRPKTAPMRSWQTYRAASSRGAHRRGRAFWRRNAPALARAENVHGVPRGDHRRHHRRRDRLRPPDRHLARDRRAQHARLRLPAARRILPRELEQYLLFAREQNLDVFSVRAPTRARSASRSSCRAATGATPWTSTATARSTCAAARATRSAASPTSSPSTAGGAASASRCRRAGVGRRLPPAHRAGIEPVHAAGRHEALRRGSAHRPAAGHAGAAGRAGVAGLAPPNSASACATSTCSRATTAARSTPQPRGPAQEIRGRR